MSTGKIEYCMREHEIDTSDELTALVVELLSNSEVEDTMADQAKYSDAADKACNTIDKIKQLLVQRNRK